MRFCGKQSAVRRPITEPWGGAAALVAYSLPRSGALHLHALGREMPPM